MEKNVISTLNELSQQLKVPAWVESHFVPEQQQHHATAKCNLSESPNGSILVCTYQHPIKEVARQVAAYLLLQEPQLQGLAAKRKL